MAFFLTLWHPWSALQVVLPGGLLYGPDSRFHCVSKTKVFETGPYIISRLVWCQYLQKKSSDENGRNTPTLKGACGLEEKRNSLVTQSASRNRIARQLRNSRREDRREVRHKDDAPGLHRSLTAFRIAAPLRRLEKAI
jgi:hypothetical protein